MSKVGELIKQAFMEAIVDTINESSKVGKVHHIQHSNGRSYFIPQEMQKNGKHSGLAFDEGSSGRGASKPKKYSADLKRDWKETPENEIPDYVKTHMK